MKPRRIERGRIKRGRIILNLTGLLVSAIALFPVYWMVLTSFRRGIDIQSPNPSFVPFPGTLNNYRKVFERDFFWTATRNTLRKSRLGSHRCQRRARKAVAHHRPDGRLDDLAPPHGCIHCALLARPASSGRSGVCHLRTFRGYLRTLVIDPPIYNRREHHSKKII
jgi:hypothetical protein